MTMDDQQLSTRPRARTAILTGAAALAFAVGAISIQPHAFAQDTATPAVACDVPAQDLSVADVAERVNPAVVTVTNLQRGMGADASEGDVPAIPGIPDVPGLPGEEPAPDRPQGAVPVGTGSGFIIDAEGHVVTNAHVVDGSDNLTVQFEDGTSLGATLVGQDDLLDVAVIKLDLANGQKVPGIACFGDSDAVRPGDEVVAIGSALGEFTNTVTEGTVNAKDRDLDGYGLGHLIQHDAEIWHGNSGGPLLNLKGQVIGINAAGISSDQMGTAPADMSFAIDGNAAKEVVDQLIETGTVDRPFLGIEGEALPLGHMVDDVVSGSGADQAGILPGDVIVSIDGTNVTRKDTLLDLLLAHKSGDTVQITVDRDGDQMTFDVTLGERPADAA
jgi:2-alkenal reductase